MGGGGEGDLQRGPQSVQSVPNSQYEEYSWPNPPSSHVLSREKLHVSLQLQPIGCLGGGGFGGGGGGHGGGDGGFGGDGGEGGGGGRGYTNVCPLQLVGCSVSSSGTQAYRQRSIRTARRCASATRAIEPTPSSSKKRPKGLWPRAKICKRGRRVVRFRVQAVQGECDVSAYILTWRHPSTSVSQLMVFSTSPADFPSHDPRMIVGMS